MLATALLSTLAPRLQAKHTRNEIPRFDCRSGLCASVSQCFGCTVGRAIWGVSRLGGPSYKIGEFGRAATLRPSTSRSGRSSERTRNRHQRPSAPSTSLASTTSIASEISCPAPGHVKCTRAMFVRCPRATRSMWRSSGSLCAPFSRMRNRGTVKWRLLSVRRNTQSQSDLEYGSIVGAYLSQAHCMRLQLVRNSGRPSRTSLGKRHASRVTQTHVSIPMTRRIGTDI